MWHLDRINISSLGKEIPHKENPHRFLRYHLPFLSSSAVAEIFISPFLIFLPDDSLFTQVVKSFLFQDHSFLGQVVESFLTKFLLYIANKGPKCNENQLLWLHILFTSIC